MNPTLTILLDRERIVLMHVLRQRQRGERLSLHRNYVLAYAVRQRSGSQPLHRRMGNL
jgi:hypothetical protein